MLQVYVISLEGCEDRRVPLLASLSSLGIQATVVVGVDGRRGLSADDENQINRELANRRARRELTDAEFACALSHQQVYQQILRDGRDLAVVLEDDAIIDGDFAKTIDELKAHESDLVLLDHLEARSRWFPNGVLASGRKLWRVVNIPSLTTGYVISAKAARILADRSLPLGYTADWPYDVSVLRTYAVDPPAVKRPPDQTTSLIESGRRSSRRAARWGHPTPPYLETGLRSRISRFVARRIS